MSAPRRLREDTSASESVRELLGHARPTSPLPRAVRERSSARLARALVAPAAGGLLVWLKGVAVAAGVVAAVAVMVRGLPLSTAPSATVAPASVAPPTDSPTPPRDPVAPLAHPVVAPPLPAPVPSHVAPSSKRSPSVTPPDDVDSLGAETAMLERARATLDSDPAAAFGVLEAHKATYPSGVLATERELLAVDTLRRLGRVHEARLRGNALLRSAQGSLYEARVRTVLSSLPSE